MDTLGSRLRYIRSKIINLKQHEFATLLEIPLDSLGRYERDAMIPSADIISRYIKKIDFNPEWLLTGEGEPFKNNQAMPKDGVDIVSSLRMTNANLEKEIELLRELNTTQKETIASQKETIASQKEAIKAYKLAIDALRMGEKQDVNKSAQYALINDQLNESY